MVQAEDVYDAYDRVLRELHDLKEKGMKWEIDQKMIEAAAKALWMQTSGRKIAKWETMDDEYRDIWRKDAKAALEAALSASVEVS